jgi:hypothetical protein
MPSNFTRLVTDARDAKRGVRRNGYDSLRNQRASLDQLNARSEQRQAGTVDLAKLLKARLVGTKSK